VRWTPDALSTFLEHVLEQVGDSARARLREAGDQRPRYDTVKIAVKPVSSPHQPGDNGSFAGARKRLAITLRQRLSFRLLPLPQSHFRAAAVLVNEFDACSL
jgi:hypothetical protein